LKIELHSADTNKTNLFGGHLARQFLLKTGSTLTVHRENETVFILLYFSGTCGSQQTYEKKFALINLLVSNATLFVFTDG